MAKRKIVWSHKPQIKLFQILDFYAKRNTPKVGMNELDTLTKGTWIFTTKDGKEKLENKNVQFKVIQSFPKFHITLLKVQFLNRKTREGELKEEYLIELL